MRQMPPRVFAEASGDGESHQDRNGEGAVFAVAIGDGADERRLGGASCGACQPSLATTHGVVKFFVTARRAKCRPAQRGRADVALAENGVAPATVGVAILRE